MKTDILPPHSDDAEAGALGCILLSPNDCLSECVEKRLAAEMFYRVQHQTLYRVLMEMFTERKAIDVITLKTRLGVLQVLDKCGGFKYISRLPDKTPSAANLEYYIDILKEKFVLRRTIQACDVISRRANEWIDSGNEFMDWMERKVADIRQSSEGSRGIVDQTECIVSLQARYAKAMQTQTHPGLKTGFRDLDDIIGGLDGPEFVILAGSQSSGKTTLLLNIFCHLARLGICTGLISLETTAEKIVHRNLCSMSGVDGRRLMSGVPGVDDPAKIAQACDELLAMKNLLLIDDSSGITLAQCQAKMRRMAQLGAKIIGIDYLQLLQTKETGAERLCAISNGIKATGKELGIPVVAVSILTREELKTGAQPRADGLFGSVQFQFDATQIWLLWVKDDEREKELRQVHGQVAKSKDTGTGRFVLDLFAPSFLFKDHCPIELDEPRRTHRSTVKDD